MELWMYTCELPKNPSQRELLTRKEETRNIQSHPEPFVNHGVKFSPQRETIACARPGKNSRQQKRRDGFSPSRPSCEPSLNRIYGSVSSQALRPCVAA